MPVNFFKEACCLASRGIDRFCNPVARIQSYEEKNRVIRENLSRRNLSQDGSVPKKFIDKIKTVIIMTIYIFGVVLMDHNNRYIPVTQAKATLLDLIRKIKDTDDTIAITKNGVPEAVLLSFDKFQGLIETLEILSDPETATAIRKSISQGDKGRWVDFDSVFSE
jgi:prevent-host-death family protein